MNIRKLSRDRSFNHLVIMNRLLRDGIVKVSSTPDRKELIEKVLKLRESDKKHNDWYHKGFVFIRFLNDYIEIKTVDENNPKSFKITIDEESLRLYIEYLQKLT